MTVRKAFKAAAITLFVIFCGLVVSALLLYWRNRRLQIADEATFEMKAVELERALPAGTPRAAVEDYARQHDLDIVEDGSSNVVFRLQRIHSAQWYCGYWIGVEQLGFDSKSDAAPRTTARRHTDGDCL
ncbi:hypothetical protein ACFQBQ_04725 [Granulicella cerasi]|uniref:Uncharacterized protein n=1 Tax=Granulicella cerasi TaxID=741063 RepID=A0ABW1Z5R2_9BACT|nr:hypothetical protein [Granulicella cerasi]